MHIQTLFLSLLVLATSFIIAFTYLKNAYSILDFATGTIGRIGNIIELNIGTLLARLERMTALGAKILDIEGMQVDTPSFIDLMLVELTQNPNVYAFYVAQPNGNFFETVNLPRTNQTQYLSKPQQRLPESAAYAVRVIKSDGQRMVDAWYYKNTAFETIAYESFPATFNATQRAWYAGAFAKRGEFWSDIYHFDPTGEAGITVASPIINKNGAIKGVVGADLSLANLSEFLREQRIGKTGKAYIVNDSGKILIPEGGDDAAIQAAYEQFIKTLNHNFIFEQNGIQYLGHVHAFGSSLQKDWLNIIVVPINEFFGDLFNSLKQAVLISAGILLLSALAIYYFAKRISKPIEQLTEEVDKLKHLDLGSERRVQSHIHEITLLDESIASMRRMLRSFGRYVPKEIIKQLLEKGQEIALGGEKRELTVFFSDIANFTPIAESFPLDEVMPPLAVYFDTISKIILQSKGTIDKYIGDGIMAFWGAPTQVPNHTEEACTAALHCQKALAAFNQQRTEENKPPFLTRMAIHTGEMIVGNIGTAERLNYTAMGDVVNETARLQQVNKAYHTWILISEEVHKNIGESFLTRPLDIVAVKGKKQKIKIYELVAKLGDKELMPTAENVQLCTLFTHAYEAYTSGELVEAKTLFEAIHQKFPRDFPTQLYLERF